MYDAIGIVITTIFQLLLPFLDITFSFPKLDIDPTFDQEAPYFELERLIAVLVEDVADNAAAEPQ